MGTMRAVFTGGGPFDGQIRELPDDQTTLWIGSVQFSWATEGDLTPEAAVSTGNLKCYRLASVRDDGLRVFRWVLATGATP